MLGSLRFILAILVFLSHFPEHYMALNLGVTAVVMFYFTSGYLMQKSATRFKQNHLQPTRAFYLDRCIKIFPQYLFVVLLTYIFYSSLGPSLDGIFSDTQFTFQRLLFDLTLVPVNLATGSLPQVMGWGDWGTSIVPPAFSLAIEFQFYLLVPLLIAMRQNWVVFLAIVSTVAFTVSSFHSVGVFSMANFGYLYLPSMLVLFLFGFLFARNEKAGFSYVLWAYFIVLFVFLLPSFNGFQVGHTQSVLVGSMLCLPIFSFCFHFAVQSEWFKSIDHFLGDLSYPVFLSHSLGLYLAQHFFGVSSDGRVYLFTAAFLVTLVLSALMASAQRAIDRKRVSLRGFSSLRS